MATTAERPPGRDAPAKPTRAQRREVARLMSDVTDDVAQIPDRHLRAFLPVLEDAKREVRNDLRRWLQNAPGASERFTAQHLRTALIQLEHAHRRIREEIPEQLEGRLRQGGRTAGIEALDHLQHEVARFSAVFGHSVRPLQLKQGAVIASGESLLIPRFRSSAARYSEAITSDIRHQLALGVARGETFEQMTNRLVRLGGPSGVVSLRGVLGEPGSMAEHISEGLFRRYRHWADRIVQTEVLEAYNTIHHEGVLEADRDDPGYLSRWDATDDRRGCDLCSGLDGMIVRLDEAFGIRENGESFFHPPAHPRCRCAHTPWRREWGTEQEEGRPHEVRAPATADEDVEAARSTRRLAEGDLDRARGSLEHSLDSRGLARRERRTDTIETGRLGRGVLGAHTIAGPNKGRIQIRPDVKRLAKQAAADLRDGNDAAVYGRPGPRESLRAVLHETLHGYGPEVSYRGTGLFIEEVTTEVTANSLLERSYRAPRSFGVEDPAYPGWVKGLRGELEGIFGVDADAAHTLLEEASDAFKRERSSAPLDNTAAVNLFARKFPDKHLEVRNAILSVSKRRP